ncbi:MAG: TPM domain-containing protein [Archangium sp.]
MRSIFAAAALVSAVAVAAPWDIAPPPRGQWVLDRTNKVNGATIGNLNSIAAALDLTGDGQLGILVTDTTSGVNPRDFATGVFNSWGVGHHGANDGILLFIALSDRKSEIVLGDGSKVKSSQTDAVMRDDIVANMKRGNLDLALLKGTASLVTLMHQAAGKPALSTSEDNTGLGGDRYVTPTTDTYERDPVLSPLAEGSASFPERSPRTWVVDPQGVLTNSQRAQLDVAASDIYSANQGRIFFLVVSSKNHFPPITQLAQKLASQVRPLSSLKAAVIAIDLNGSDAAIDLPTPPTTDWELLQVANAQTALFGTAHTDRVAALLGAKDFAQQAMISGIPSKPMNQVLAEGYYQNQGVLLIIAGVAAFIGLLWLRRWNRKRIRTCEECKNPRQLLGDAAEDEHLDAAQLKEESIRSVDYDVWWCGRCDDVLVLRYGAWFSSYSTCSGCGAKTLSSNTTTLRHATEWSGGLQRIDEKCVNCSYTNSYTRSTARLSSSSSSSSWSSSSSSSGSSFGGGSSSGGGSSGSW